MCVCVCSCSCLCSSPFPPGRMRTLRRSTSARSLRLLLDKPASHPANWCSSTHLSHALSKALENPCDVDASGCIYSPSRDLPRTKEGQLAVEREKVSGLCWGIVMRRGVVVDACPFSFFLCCLFSLFCRFSFHLISSTLHSPDWRFSKSNLASRTVSFRFVPNTNNKKQPIIPAR